MGEWRYSSMHSLPWHNFMLWLLYPEGKSPWYPLNRSLGWPQDESGYSGEEKNSCPCWELNPSHPAHSLVTILAVL